MRYVFLLSAIALMIIAATVAQAQTTPSGSDAAYIAAVSKGAPASIVTNATIVQVQKDGSMRTVQKGTNGFTCMMLDPSSPGCADKNALAWMQALMTKSTPPNATGFMYMLAGDGGTSNTDPYATKPSPTNHWVKTGPHVMIVGPGVKTMGYPMSADADPSKPYVMWPNTPYAHLMIPVSNP